LVRAKTTVDAAVGEIEVLFKQAGRRGVADSPLKDELKLTFAAAGCDLSPVKATYESKCEESRKKSRAETAER